MFATPAVTKMLSIAVVLGAAAAPAFAQATPYVAAVSRETVNVRAQASGNHLVVGRLVRGDQVVVTRIVRDWAKVRLPGQFRIWISAKYVKQNGTTGTVTATRLNLRPSPGLEGTPVGQAQRGDRVRIYGAKNGFFEIAPTSAASGWVFKSTLKFVKPGKDAKIKGDDLGRDKKVAKNTERKPVAQPIKASTDWVAKAWDAFTATQKGAVGTRDFTSTRSFLNRAKTEGGSPQQIVALERRLAAAEAADTKTKEIEEEYLNEILRQKAEYEALEKKFRIAVENMGKVKAPKPYTATGTLKAMGMVWNRPGTHQMVDAKGNRFFLKSVSVNLYKARWYGKKCGVRGQIVDLPGWGKVIEVHELIYLDNPKRK
jgi:uncharacterized protein YgiM (DUF1202 family)